MDSNYYRLQVHSLKCTISHPSDSSYSVRSKPKSRKLFVELSSEGQPAKRFNLGVIDKHGTWNVESVLHLTDSNTPITLQLLELTVPLPSWLMNSAFRAGIDFGLGVNMSGEVGGFTRLGGRRISEFIQGKHHSEKKSKIVELPNSDEKDDDDIIWGVLNVLPRRANEMYIIKYSISRVSLSYGFITNQITCLSKNSMFGRDLLTASVEFNPCPLSIIPGSMNSYDMGDFGNSTVRAAHTTHNAMFVTLSNFRMVFWLTSSVSGKKRFLGQMGFYMLNTLDSSRFGALKIFKDMKNSLLDLVGSNEAIENIKLKTKRKENINRLKELKTAVLWVYPGGEEIILLGDQLKCSRKVILKVDEEKETGVYEIIFSLTKTPFLFNVSKINNPTKGKGLLSPIRAGWRVFGDEFEQDIKVSRVNDVMIFQRSIRVPTVVKVHKFSPKMQEIMTNNGSLLTWKNYDKITKNNKCEILIDGADTFHRYFQVLMNARHSIYILAWELSLSFGLVLANNKNKRPPLPEWYYNKSPSKWITLQDVLLYQALQGLKVRIMVWRHPFISMLTRLMYLGSFTIENELRILEKRASALGLTIKVFHTFVQGATHSGIPDRSSCYSTPGDKHDADIVVIVVRNPKGFLSSYHEKLILVDSECPQHTIAFVGGFDIAKGRFDQQAHYPPTPLFKTAYDAASKTGAAALAAVSVSEELITKPELEEEIRYTGTNIQPFLTRIRFLWHDIQTMIVGPCVNSLHLHFLQRWAHAFETYGAAYALDFGIAFPEQITNECNKHHDLDNSWDDGLISGCEISSLRVWQGVVEDRAMLSATIDVISNAENYIYVEHQYAFQNFSLTHCLVDRLKENPKLQVVIICPIETNLPKGVVGEIVDLSSDHVNHDLELIYNTAPDRVGVYALLRQDERSKQLKPIYVHAKFMIVDDEYVMNGSTNFDDLSFFRSCELSVMICSKKLAVTSKVELFKEHLGKEYRPSMENYFEFAFDAFKKIADENSVTLRQKEKLLVGRPVHMVPLKNIEFLQSIATSPTWLDKTIVKFGTSKEKIIEKIPGHNLFRGVGKILRARL